VTKSASRTESPTVPKNLDAKAIGKELGVRYVLEGSVQRDGTRVRVNAQLIDAESGAHLWADRFDEDVADLFKLQDEVVCTPRPHASGRAGERRSPT
jgi:TolB-like protein